MLSPETCLCTMARYKCIDWLIENPILALFARINKPLWLIIRSTGAEVAGGQKTFSSNGYDFYLVSVSRFMSDKDRVSTVSSSRTKIETGGFQDQDRDQDSEVPRPRPRLRGSRQRPRPRLVKMGLETKTQVSRTPSLLCSNVNKLTSQHDAQVQKMDKLVITYFMHGVPLYRVAFINRIR